MINEQIKNKLQKLFAMAQNNSNENEIAIALAKAQKIMEEYNLSESDIIEDNNYVTESIRNDGKNKEVWKGHFGKLVAELNFCEVFLMGSTLCFFGKKKNVDLAIYQFHNVISQIENICDEKFQVYKFNGGNVHGKTWKNNFYFGAVNSIREKMTDIEKHEKEVFQYLTTEEKEKKVNESRALELLDYELTVELNKAHKIKKGKTTKFRYNYDGYLEGKKSGSEFQFNMALGK